MQSLAERTKIDQHEKKAEFRPKVDSFAKDMKFGANLHKFEFKEEKAPRG